MSFVTSLRYHNTSSPNISRTITGHSRNIILNKKFIRQKVALKPTGLFC